MQVIGITGWAGSGKSTVAEYLVKEHGFTRLSFAAPLKKMLRTLNPIIGNAPKWATDRTNLHLNDLFAMVEVSLEGAELSTSQAEQEIKESSWGDEYRRLLQVLGTDCIRAVDPDFWVKAAMAQMTNPGGRYVFDDCRFPNEAEAIETYNPLGLWNVYRPGYAAINSHASEQWAGCMNEAVVLLNGSDIEGLHDQIDAAVELAFDGVAS